LAINFRIFDKIRKAVNDLPKFVKTRLRQRVTRKVAEVFLAKLKNNILSQNLNLAPLSEAYAKFKEQQGLDVRILIATETLVSALEVFEVNKMAVAGVPAGKMSNDGKIAMDALFALLEMGSPSQNLPARPVFALTALELERELRRVAIKEIQLAADGFYADFR